MMDRIEALTRAMWNIDESLIQECLDADEETDKVSSAPKARRRPAKKRLLWAAGIAAAVLLSGITTYAVTDLYRKYKPYEYFFKNGEVNVFRTLNHTCTEEERQTVQPVLEKAESVFRYIGTEAEADLSVGPFTRYYHFAEDGNPDIAKIDLTLNLITAKIDGDEGYMWVEYCIDSYDSKGELCYSSGTEEEKILSYWEIRRIDRNWEVVRIIEAV
jgi:hypothetical protein